MAQQSIEDQRSKVGVVFWVSAAVSLAFILWGVISPTSFGTVTQAVFDWVVSNLGWFYLLAGNFFLIFVFLLALSRYGKFRLGQEGERPQFSTFAWFAMMFQAGMGPSLIFWGVAEPLSRLWPTSCLPNLVWGLLRGEDPTNVSSFLPRRVTTRRSRFYTTAVATPPATYSALTIPPSTRIACPVT